jgi:hypothetical protein
MDETPEPLTDDEFAALLAEIMKDIALDQAMHGALAAKVERWEAERARREQAEVREFRPRPSGPGRTDQGSL